MKKIIALLSLKMFFLACIALIIGTLGTVYVEAPPSTVLMKGIAQQQAILSEHQHIMNNHGILENRVKTLENDVTDLKARN